jgi:hypothetical protein
MNDRPSSSLLTGPAILVAVVLALLIPYVAGYFLLGDVSSAGAMRFRIYEYKWQEVIYRPATAAESLFTGRQVNAAYRIDDG